MLRVIVSRVADSDSGTGSTEYREVCDKAWAVTTHGLIHRGLFPGLLTLIQVQGVQGTGRFLIRLRQ
jgi:hypothetical protein